MTLREHSGHASAAAFAAPDVAGSSTPAASNEAAIDRSRSALIFIEFQNEWLDPAAPLNRLMEDRPQFDDAVRNASRIIEAARQGGFPIVHAGLSLVNDPTYQLFGGRKDKAGLRGAIQRAGTWRDPERVAFPEPFTPRQGEFIVAGRSGASVITNSNLDAYLRNNGIDRLYLMGFALHVCVESTLRQAHDLGYEATIISDAAPAFTSVQRDHVLSDVVHHFGHHITTEQFLENWGRA